MENIIEFGTEIQAEMAFVSFQAALEYVFKLLIDKYKDGSKLMLILCGSSMSYMEEHLSIYCKWMID